MTVSFTQSRPGARGFRPPLLGAPSAKLSTSAAPSGRPRRIVLYSHDTQGLGHMRRNLLIAQALLRVTPRPNILLIGGARELGALTIPPGIDCVTLPALRKSGDGEYRPRSLSVSLGRIIALRSGAISAALQSFDPDLLIVDKVPLGAFDELAAGLEWLRGQGKAKVVLGLREILDEPAVARSEWSRSGADAAIRRYYDAVWVYGDPHVFDSAQVYGFSSVVTERLTYTGYIDRSFGAATADGQAELEQLGLAAEERLALCLVGGGQDGYALADCFARAALPAGTTGLIVTGPFMPVAAREQLAERLRGRGDMRLLSFVDEPGPLLRRADAVVTMGGYNTVCEILAYDKPALIVPRVQPRREQLIRAQRLLELGLADMLHPDALSPDALGGWLRRDRSTAVEARRRIDMGALDRLPGLVDGLFATLEEQEYGA